MASKSSIQAGRGHVTLGTDDGPLVKGLEAAQKKFASWGKGIAATGAGIALAGAGWQAPFHYALSVLQEDGGNLARVSQQTGIDVGALGPLAYAVGGNMDGLSAAMRRMNTFLLHAAHGGGEAQRALAELGLSIEELIALRPEERFERIADALSRIGDVGQRSALQTQILSREAAKLRLGSQEQLQARAAQGRRLGQLSPEDVRLARELNQAERDLGVATRATWGFIGAAVAPYMTTFVRQVTEIILVVQHWVRENGPLMLTLFKVAEWVTITGLVLGGLGTAIYVASFAFTFLAGAVGIVGSVLGSLWGFAVFASSGFGILSASVFSWATVTSVASGIATAAVWGWAIGVSAISALVSGAYAAWSLGASAWGIATTIAVGIVTGAYVAWGVLVAIVSGAHAIGTAALAGFGIATGIVTALTWLDNAALAVWVAGVWLINAAHVAAVAVLGLFTGATAGATAANAVFAAGLIFTWIWENICTAGIYLIVTAIGLLIAAVVLVPLAWVSWLAILGIIAGVNVAIGSIGVALLGLAAGVAAMALALVAIAVGAVAKLSDLFGHAFDSLMPAASSAFDGVLGTVRTAVAAIGDAMMVGDFALIWEVVKTAAELAWLEISDFVTSQFPAWKTEALAVWQVIADALEDALYSAFTAVKAMWQELIGEIISGAYRAWAAVQREMGLDTRAAANEVLATNATRDAQQDAETTRQNANRARIDRETARRRRDEETALAAEMADLFAEDNPSANAERIDELRERLAGLRDTAREEAAMAEWLRPGAGGETGGDEGFTGTSKSAAVGSFFADALMGMFGAGGDTPAARQLAATNRTNALMERIANRLDGMNGPAFR